MGRMLESVLETLRPSLLRFVFKLWMKKPSLSTALGACNNVYLDLLPAFWIPLYRRFGTGRLLSSRKVVCFVKTAVGPKV